MLSNDILRSLRYTLKANNNDMVRILALADMESTSAGFDTWMTKEDEGVCPLPGYYPLRIPERPDLRSAAKMIRRLNWRLSVR